MFYNRYTIVIQYPYNVTILLVNFFVKNNFYNMKIEICCPIVPSEN